jgi:ABC-type antimicrobial peptide transport system permease subunit
LLGAVRAEVAALDPLLVIHRAAPLAEVVGRGVARERFALVLIGTFAGVALLLSAIGLYGVLAYIARERRQEMGIRMMLGATATNVRKLVLGQAARIVVVGVALGLAGVVASGPLLESLLYETGTREPFLLAGATLLLIGATLLAAYLPARRAARVPPLAAMQDE